MNKGSNAFIILLNFLIIIVLLISPSIQIVTGLLVEGDFNSTMVSINHSIPRLMTSSNKIQDDIMPSNFYNEFSSHNRDSLFFSDLQYTLKYKRGNYDHLENNLFASSYKTEDILSSSLEHPSYDSMQKKRFIGQPNRTLSISEVSYSPHDPILIEGNDQLIQKALEEEWEGDGSSLHPYIITNLHISSGETFPYAAIYITDTDLHFSICNCLLQNSLDWGSGIELINVANVKIHQNNIENTIINGYMSGIQIEGCTNIEIYQNELNKAPISIGASFVSPGGDLIRSTNIQIYGNTVTGVRFTSGISLKDSINSIVTSNYLYDNLWGIYFWDSSNCEISGNEINNFDHTMIIQDAPNNIIKDNEFFNGGIRYYATSVENCFQTQFSNNYVNGKPIIFWQSIHDGTVPSGAGQVILVDCVGVEVSYQSMEKAGTCIHALYCTNVNIHDNDLSTSLTGIYLKSSSECLVTNNNAVQNSMNGVECSHSDSIVIDNNIVTNNEIYGISLFYCSGSTISNNIVQNNDVAGICLWSSTSNLIKENNACYNQGEGIYLYESDSNMISNNDVHNNLYNGILIILSSTVKIIDNIISYNELDGILIEDNSVDNQIAGNYVQFNKGYGISVNYSPRNNISDNIISNGYLLAIFVDNCDSVLIRQNNVSYNADYSGIFIINSDSINITDNIIHDNINSAIYIENTPNNEITNNTIYNNGQNGIELWQSPLSKIISNSVFENLRGVLLLYSSGCNISKNEIFNNNRYGIYTGISMESIIENNNLTNHGLYIDGVESSHFLQASVKGNLVNNKPLIFHQNQNGLTISTDVGQVILVNCHSIIVESLAISAIESALIVVSCSNIAIQNCFFTNNIFDGIWLALSSDSLITDNTLNNNGLNGIRLTYCDNISVSYNEISNNGYRFQAEYGGIALSYLSTNNKINNNYISGNRDFGVGIANSFENKIFDNEIYYNEQYGIYGIASDEGISYDWFINITANFINDNGATAIHLEHALNSDITSNEIRNNGKNGIELWESHDANIVLNYVSQNYYGVFPILSSDCHISDNDIFNNEFGLYLLHSGNNYICGNNFVNDGLYLQGQQLNHHLQASVSGNLVNNKPLVFYQNQNGLTVPTDAGQVVLVSCSSIIVKNVAISNTDVGLFAAHCTNLIVQNCVFTENRAEGIFLVLSSDSLILNNNIVNNGIDGIGLMASSNITISYNLISTNGYKTWINVWGIEYDVWGGIMIQYYSINNKITYNTIINNHHHGIRYSYPGCSDNEVFWNNFIDNNEGGCQAYEEELSGIYSGNYWNDHTSPDANSDGIVDIPYYIAPDGNNNDPYPYTSANGWTILPTPADINVQVTESTSEVSITYNIVSVTGTTSITISDYEPETPSGFEITGIYYAISTTATYTGMIEITIPYEESQISGDEAALRLLHWNEDSEAWEDVTTWIDVENNIIYGEVSNLSIFAVMEAIITPFEVISFIGEDQSTTITSFDVIFSKYNPEGYKLVATNPGQFFYQVEFINTWPITINQLIIDLTLPSDFILQGMVPIHVYLNELDYTELCEVVGTTITIPIVPSGSSVHLTIHLDYALKGVVYPTPDVFEMQGYLFTCNINADGLRSYSSTINLTTHQKKTTAIAGFVFNEAQIPLGGIIINLRNETGHIVQTTLTNTNGYYYFIDIDARNYVLEVIIANQPTKQVTAIPKELIQVDFFVEGT